MKTGCPAHHHGMSVPAMLAAAVVVALAACDRASDPASAAAVPGSASASVAGTPVATCIGCHGANGEGNAAAGFPRLAGQSRVYLLHQLESFVDGGRASPVMAPIARAMAPEQRAAAAAHFASIATPAGAPAPGPDAGDAVRGRQIAEVGDHAKQLQACANCHGPGGVGVGMQLPYLAGKPAPYLAAALAAYRDGSRRSDPTGQMPQIAKLLDEADAQALAAYYARQPPPAVPLDAAVAEPSAPATASSPKMDPP
jgi:cytochrome c553